MGFSGFRCWGIALTRVGKSTLQTERLKQAPQIRESRFILSLFPGSFSASRLVTDPDKSGPFS